MLLGLSKGAPIIILACIRLAFQQGQISFIMRVTKLGFGKRLAAAKLHVRAIVKAVIAGGPVATPIIALAADQVRNLEKSSPTKLFNF
jgi:hypothetical protein